MPEPVAGFYGKLPSRGDFLRVGLPRGFIDPWDAWLQQGIAASRAALGESWEASWMEAPVWRFALPAGVCGEAAVLGLWMPSADRAGRHFPLTIAILAYGAEAGAVWLDGAEQAGLDALEHLLEPEALSARLAALALPETKIAPTGESLWWTAGSPFVSPANLRLAGLPDQAAFTTMLNDRQGIAAPARHVEAP